MKKKNPILIVVALLAALAGGHWTLQRQESVHQGPISGNTHRVAYVYDGDTIKLDNGERVRLIGIDTPETHANAKLSKDVKRRRINREAQLAMGQEAAKFTRALVEGKEVRLEFDVEPKDRYQRTLAYVYLTDGTFVNEKIIREGYAYPLTIPPNVRHAHQFKQWFDEARENKRGLWN
jgi:micrococcal nuclease